MKRSVEAVTKKARKKHRRYHCALCREVPALNPRSQNVRGRVEVAERTSHPVSEGNVRKKNTYRFVRGNLNNTRAGAW